MRRILIVEDNAEECQDLADILRHDNYDVVTAADAATGIRLVRQKRPDLVILDWELPDTNGDRVCAELRRENDPPIILMLTGRRTDPEDETKALRLRADEYMRKPYSELVLLERIEKLFRQRGGGYVPVDSMDIDDLFVDFLAYDARRGPLPIDMSAKEFAVLRYLVSRGGTLVTRSQLKAHVWTSLEEDKNVNRMLDNVVHSLRTKLDLGDRIKTKRGAGHKFAKSYDVFVTIRGKRVCLADI